MALGRSISLAAYMALARRGPRKPIEFPAPRPEGPLIWGHATSAARAAALLQIGARLRVQRPEINLLLTGAEESERPDHMKSQDFWQVLPDDSVSSDEQFLNHWRPDICLWTGGFFRPAMIVLARRRNLPMFLIDAGEEGFNAPHQRWLPDMVRANLQEFDAIFARSGTAAQMLRKLGVSDEDIVVTGPLQEGGGALPCNEREREDMARQMAGRPVWLAAMTQIGELPELLAAHRQVSRMAHRLLLIVVPDDEGAGPAFRDYLRGEGVSVAVRSDGENPDENTQVYLADTRGEMGLWYRLAPVTFMGSSLVAGFGGQDPYEPAALGSAILYGPNISRHLAAYTKFAAAGAARIVKDSGTLSAALQNLAAPDQAALMAAAAWGVASEGAEVTDRVIDLVQDTLDVLEAR
jgi:3-deoxy-D-manno-octulosonic-acid transferase